ERPHDMAHGIDRLDPIDAVVAEEILVEVLGWKRGGRRFVERPTDDRTAGGVGLTVSVGVDGGGVASFVRVSLVPRPPVVGAADGLIDLFESKAADVVDEDA